MSSLADRKLVFLDVETTGFSVAAGDRVVEIGLIVCQGRRVIRQIHSLCRPQREIPAEATRVHGISDKDVAGAPLFAALADDVCSALDGACVVAHNFDFDAGFVALELARCGRVARPAACLDTWPLSEACWDLPRYKLQTVAAELGLADGQDHRALADARLCRGVFHRVVREQGGWDRVKLSRLRRLCPQSRWPAPYPASLHPRLRDAIRRGRSLQIHYLDWQSTRTRRRIRPHACIVHRAASYLFAFCELRGAERVFRLDRVRLPR